MRKTLLALLLCLGAARGYCGAVIITPQVESDPLATPIALAASNLAASASGTANGALSTNGGLMGANSSIAWPGSSPGTLTNVDKIVGASINDSPTIIMGGGTHSINISGSSIGMTATVGYVDLPVGTRIGSVLYSTAQGFQDSRITANKVILDDTRDNLSENTLQDMTDRLLPSTAMVGIRYDTFTDTNYINFRTDLLYGGAYSSNVTWSAGQVTLNVVGAEVLWYKLNEDAANTTVADGSGQGHAGVATENTANLHAAGKVGTGSFLLGGTQYVTATGYKGVTGTADWGVSVWFKCTSRVADRDLLSWGVPTGGNLFELYLNSANGNLWLMSTAGDTLTAPSDFADSAWHHVVVTCTNMFQAMYIDGAWVDDGAKLQPIDNSQDVRIGARATDASTPWVGGIDDVRIYDRGLTVAEIATLYATGSGTPNAVGGVPYGWASLVSTNFASVTPIDGARLVIHETGSGFEPGVNVFAKVTGNNFTNMIPVTLEEYADGWWRASSNGWTYGLGKYGYILDITNDTTASGIVLESISLGYE